MQKVRVPRLLRRRWLETLEEARKALLWVPYTGRRCAPIARISYSVVIAAAAGGGTVVAIVQRLYVNAGLLQSRKGQLVF